VEGWRAQVWGSSWYRLAVTAAGRDGLLDGVYPPRWVDDSEERGVEPLNSESPQIELWVPILKVHHLDDYWLSATRPQVSPHSDDDSLARG